MSITLNAIQYTVKQLFEIAIPGVPSLIISTPNCRNIVVTLPSGAKIAFALLSEAELQSFIGGTLPATLSPSADDKEQIPVFCPAHCDSSKVVYQTTTDTLHIPFDFVSISFLLLSREEEYHDILRDEHNRFQYQGSLACQYNFIRLPLVDEYAMLLRKWVSAYFHARVRIQPRLPQIIPTHDIDLLHRFYSPWQAFRSIFGRDLLLDHSLSEAKESITDYRKWKTDSLQDPYIQSILQLIRTDRQYGLSGVFFFKGLTVGTADCTYDIFDDHVRFCIDHIREHGMGVGLHGSYDSYDDIARFESEKRNLERVTGSAITSCRQHYLRFNLARNLQGEELDVSRAFATGRTPEYNLTTTLQVWQACSIRDDYTLGYAEQPGFRCGTCHPYPLYDLENDCPTNIIEHPLILMDGSLFDYLKLNITDSNMLLQQLYQRCRAVEGDFVILWHNHTLCRQYTSVYQKIYLHFLQNK